MALLRSRVTRMGATIDGLLDYARIGRTDANIEPVSVAELLAETIDSIAPPPTFAIAIAPNLPTLNTKRLFLAQVFANLISNVFLLGQLIHPAFITHIPHFNFYDMYWSRRLDSLVILPVETR